MNKINKATLITAVFISLNGIGSAAPTAKNNLPSEPISCNIALAPNACLLNVNTLNLSTKFPAYADTSAVNHIVEHRVHSPNPEKYTFTVKAHPGEGTYPNYELQKKEFAYARFGLSRATHDERLKVVDGETNNAHAQFKVMLHLDSTPTIEEYMQFFLYSGYFTVDK